MRSDDGQPRLAHRPHATDVLHVRTGHRVVRLVTEHQWERWVRALEDIAAGETGTDRAFRATFVVWALAELVLGTSPEATAAVARVHKMKDRLEIDLYGHVEDRQFAVSRKALASERFRQVYEGAARALGHEPYVAPRPPTDARAPGTRTHPL